MTAIVVAAIAALGSCLAAWLTATQGRLLKRELQTNHHASDPPTVLDRLDCLSNRMNDHLAESAVDRARLRRVEDAVLEIHSTLRDRGDGSATE